jgi:hypothetical protein
MGRRQKFLILDLVVNSVATEVYVVNNVETTVCLCCSAEVPLFNSTSFRAFIINITLYIMNITLYIMNITLYIMNITLYIMNITLCIMNITLCIMNITLYIMNITLYITVKHSVQKCKENIGLYGNPD